MNNNNINNNNLDKNLTNQAQNNNNLDKNLSNQAQNNNNLDKNLSNQDQDIENLRKRIEGLKIFEVPEDTGSNPEVISKMALNDEQEKVLKNSLEELKETAKLAKENNIPEKTGFFYSEDEDEGKPYMSSDEEAFPKYNQNSSLNEAFPIFSSILENNPELFKQVSEVVDKVKNSKIMSKLLEEKGLLNSLTLFNSQSLPEGFEKLLEKQLKTDDPDKPIFKGGEFGEMTLNEAYKQGFKLISPLIKKVENIDPNYLITGGSLIGIVLMFKGLCAAYDRLVNKGAGALDLRKITPNNRLLYEQMRLRNINNFKGLAAPIIVASLFAIKTVTLTPKINITINTSTGGDIPTNYSINNNNNTGEALPTSHFRDKFLIPFFTKSFKNIGKYFILYLIIVIIKYILDSYSIDLLTPIYIKWFFLFGIILFSCLFLYYLIQFFIFKYISNHKDIIISNKKNKLPVIIYEHLEAFKELAHFKSFIREHFYLNFIIYGSLIIIFTFLFLLI
jgi:hypothetical protein